MATPITNVEIAVALSEAVGSKLPKKTTASVSSSGHKNDIELGEKQVEDEHDLYIVDFDGPDDPYNPVNWPNGKKWGLLVMVASMTLITPLAPSMLSSALPEVFAEYPPSKSILASLVVSVYALGLAFGPLVIAPLSELYGRTTLYHITSILFIIFSIACGVSSNLNMLTVFQFLLGCAGSAPITMGGGSVADMFSQTERGARIAILAIGPLLTLIFGPVAGSFLAAAKGWRWLFWLLAILTGAVEVGYCFFVRETYAPVLLERKTRRLRKETSNQALRSRLDSGLSAFELIIRSLTRPFKMLFLFPVVFGLALHVAVGYSYFYLLLTTLAVIFVEPPYLFGGNVVGLVFLGIGIGMAIGATLFGIFSDRMIKRRAGAGKMKPEHRLEPMVGGGILIPVGLFIYGWSAQYGIQWFVPIFGTGFVGMGLMWLLLPIDTYLVDAYPMYAASSIGATTVFRSVISAFLPLAGPSMYARLGLGWGNSLLAFIAILLIPVPLVFLKYGEAVRKNPKFQREL